MFLDILMLPDMFIDFKVFDGFSDVKFCCLDLIGSCVFDCLCGVLRSTFVVLAVSIFRDLILSLQGFLIPWSS